MGALINGYNPSDRPILKIPLTVMVVQGFPMCTLIVTKYLESHAINSSIAVVLPAPSPPTAANINPQLVKRFLGSCRKARRLTARNSWRQNFNHTSDICDRRA